MPTRKQRQRRQKTFRHDYTLVDYDEEGNEIETSASALRAKKGKPEKPKAGKAPSGSRRSLREPPVPSWRRSLRRGGLWGAVMLIVVVAFFKNTTPLGVRIAIGLLYGIAFVPLTYWIDRVAYRSYLKRSGKN
jgi:hypothetical protein